MKVAVSGYYGFRNTGDEAIALAISRQLRARGHTPLLLSSDPAFTAQTCHCESAPRMSPLGLLGALKGSDLLLSGGGGLLQDKTSSRTLGYYLGVIWAAKMLGKRVVVFNQSIGPLSAKGGTQVARALKDVRFIVRDRGSLETLWGLGLTGKLGGDPALLLQPTVTRRDENTIVVAPRGDVTETLPTLREAVAQWQAQGRRVLALSFMPQQDDQAAQSLGADEVVSTHDPQRALDAIAGAGFVVGVRLHALILAAAAGVPFAGVAYDPKVAGFCADAGAAYVPTTFSAPDLVALALGRQTPDWAAVTEMKARAADSFDWALGS